MAMATPLQAHWHNCKGCGILILAPCCADREHVCAPPALGQGRAPSSLLASFVLRR